MKKIAAMFLGLSLMLGATSAFAADDTTKTAKTKTKTTSKGKKAKTKKTDTHNTEKKS